MKISPFLAALLLFSLASCETVIDLPAPEHTPSLAVRHWLGTVSDTDSATRVFFAGRQLYVSASQRLFDTSPLTGLNTATARLYDDGAGGALVEEYEPAPPYSPGQVSAAGYYQPTRGFRPQPGGTYRLRVEAPGYAAVESRLTLPPAPPVLSNATFTPQPGGSDPYTRQGRLTVSIQDDGATDDYYVAFARVLEAAGQPLTNGYVYEETDNSNGGVSDLQTRLSLSNAFGNGTLYPYADTDVNGRTFTFSADVRVTGYDPFGGGGLPPGAQLEVIISRTTRDTYRFWLSEQRYYDANGNPFAEPAPLYSNIQGGFGLFGGYADGVVRVGL